MPAKLNKIKGKVLPGIHNYYVLDKAPAIRLCQVLNDSKLAVKYFNTDAKWYLSNIPFFECSDKQIEQVYYYRWKMYKAHIRHVGDNEYVITEFINHVAWDREPYCTIDAASMHHIYEGRWLKDNRYINGYIYNLCQQGGNNRHYSESISSVKIYLVADGKTFDVPDNISIEYKDGTNGSLFP